ncbi:MAG TPA: hypothetical protein VGJ36_00185, partial [Gemmatimonadales bacterium]
MPAGVENIPITICLLAGARAGGALGAVVGLPCPHAATKSAARSARRPVTIRRFIAYPCLI